ncbi:MAG: HAMP domain-containing histidine kinase [Methyloversatilis discipulorum]|uniref:HAMP domain-containing sensor histidine kinase n=1 Tax=Methyloversatilis discipulorum TaxID=1119528 RepID=UPI0026F04B2E|nr:HAMP domain-containing sensor histidine kinase [Methyloversatilis discipulorum]MBV5287954.1 HAMP domain-containing histidine kinase [Methyloversatilis discipulorum]
MGRLFWKLFFAFVAALAVAALLVALAFSVIWPRDGGRFRPTTVLMADTVADLLQQRGADAARGLLEVWRARGEPLPWVIAPDGGELLGRTPPQDGDMPVRAIVVDGAEWRVVQAPRPPPAGRMRLPPPPFVEVVAFLIGAIASSALLAGYLSRPVRHLHRAFDAMAQGDLEVRIAPLIGRRRDEIADLGRGFDRMATRIEQLVDAQRRLLHDVSHELRSPLARMSAAIGLARQDPSRIEAMLERVERETARLDTLVGELLGLARLEHDAARTLPQPVALDALLHDVAGDARFEAAARDVEVVLSTDGAGPVVKGQVELLRRTFDNVLRNAVKYAPAGSVVHIALGRANGSARVSISDRGCGVADGELERIFDPFFRGERSDGGHGAGLGLSIARRAVEAHGGDIRASNAEGGGLRVDIRLPAED